MRKMLPLVLLWLMACQTPTSLSEQELKDYTLDVDNGLLVEKSTNKYKLQVYNKPTGLLIAQELGQSHDTVKYNALKAKYEQYLYFILDMSYEDKNPLYASGSQDAFSENLQTLSFRMNQYVNLTTASQDTIPVLDFVYPRTFGMAPSASLMFVFDKEKLEGHDTFWFNLYECGMSTGNQRFKFNTSAIHQAPSLNIE